jgi:hypothetical protein
VDYDDQPWELEAHIMEDVLCDLLTNSQNPV